MFFVEPKKKKIVILLGHPDRETLSGHFAVLYEQAALKAGHEVRRFNIGDMQFDPILHQGYKVIQELEPDLKELQGAIKWCDHLLVIYPNWWCTMPALLKGLFDRMWLPGFCFGFYKEGWRKHLNLWKRMMNGKTARVVVLSGTHPFLIWLVFGDYTNEIKRGILWFAGFKVKMSLFGPTEKVPEWKKNEWRKKVLLFAKRGE